jgi:DNA polymerase-4
MTATRDITTYDDMQAMVLYLSEKISARMLKHSFKGAGIHVDLRSFELKHASRQVKLARPVFSSSDIAEEAMKLVNIIWQEGSIPVRSVSVSVFDLSPIDSGVQLSFFEQKPDKREKLELAVESIRKKYGRDSLKRASLIERDFIYDKNDDEDFLPFKR